MKNRRKRVKDSINQGAPDVISALRMIYAAEVLTWYQYNHVRGQLLGNKNVEVSNMLAGIALDELADHADKIQMRLIELGAGVPEVEELQHLNQIPPILGIHAAREYLLGCAVQEDLTINWYKNLVVQAQSYGDVTTSNLIEDLIADEEQHCCDMQKYASELYGDTIGIQVANLGQIVIYVLGGSQAQIIAYAVGPELHNWAMNGDLAEEVKALHERINNIVSCTDLSQVAACLQNDQPCTCEPLELSCQPAGGDTYCKVGTCEFVEPTVSILDSIITKLGDKFKPFKAVMDSLEEREVNGKKVKVTKFNNAEEANKFLEQNKGFTQVDQDETGEVYVALDAEANKEQ